MRQIQIMLCCWLGCCVPPLALAQQGTSNWVQPARHALWLESNWYPPYAPATPAMLMVGYEYTYGRSRDGSLQGAVRMGVGTLGSLREMRVTNWAFPITHHLSIGSQAHRLETAIGAAYLTDSPLRFLPVVQIGYRYQPRSQGLIWRVHIGSPGVGASVGWAF